MVELPAASPAASLPPSFVPLPQRGVVAIGGRDAREFLQNLVSNDVGRLTPQSALYALLLTPQGKYLHDFFLVMHDDAPTGATLLLDAERARIPDLLRRLTLYRLRSDVTLADVSDRYAIAAAFGHDTARQLSLGAAPGSARVFAGGVAFLDPRVAELGARVMLPALEIERALSDAGFASRSVEQYEALRLGLGVPDASRDLIIEKTFPLEAGLDDLHAIDYTKGCYVGQELTARTHYRGTIRKRLLPVLIDGPAPESGTPVMLGNVEVGEMRSAIPGIGLALLRLEHVETAERSGTPLRAGAATLRAAPAASFKTAAAEAGRG